MQHPTELSVFPVLPRLAEALATRSAAVLVAPPGSGKTSLVPPALAAAGIGGGRRIVMLEPRRIAARAAARWIAGLMGVELGTEVGYQVRFERRAGAATRILVVTEGILIQMLQADPLLDGIGVLIFDEFHERSLDADLALAMARQVQQEVRPDLALLVMSATLDPAPLAAFLGGCPVLTASGRLHPVEVIHAAVDPIVAVRQALDASTGDVLVFLPGFGEIQRTAGALADLAARRDLAVLPLHGDLPPERQDEALRPWPKRKVVLATNVAETSITIDGIAAVVDSGLARRLRYDPATGLDRLELTRISRAAAEQRAGRAGRQQPGLCLRLWTAREHATRPAFETPEIARVDLAGPVLQLLAFGERDLEGFGWYEPPAAEALAAARLLLARLGALPAAGTTALTDLGRRMARLPVHPRLARLLLEGQRRGAAAAAALAAALLAERDPFVRPPRRRAAVTVSRSDLLDRLEVLAEWRGGGAAAGATEVHPAGAQRVLRARDHLLELLRRQAPRNQALRSAAELAAQPYAPTRDPASAPSGPAHEDALLRALLAAYPDRVARRRGPHDRRGRMVGGRGVRLAEGSAVLGAELFIGVDVAAAAPGPQAEDLVRLASEVLPGWLPAERVQTTVELELDAARERVAAWQRTRYEDLVLTESEVPPADADAAAALLAGAAAERLTAALPLDEPEVASFLARVRCLRGWMPEIGLPALDEPEIAALLPELARGRRSFAELRRAPLLDRLRGLLTFQQLAALEREAPERLAVPSGSRIRLVYEEGKPPVLAARIQELFGLADTPRVAAGRVPVTLHLLAPNQRPQQVTADLRSFWQNTYPQVRKELQGRYPRHAWPADPWNASPERRPAPRRRS